MNVKCSKFSTLDDKIESKTGIASSAYSSIYGKVSLVNTRQTVEILVLSIPCYSILDARVLKIILLKGLKLWPPCRITPSFSSHINYRLLHYRSLGVGEMKALRH